MKIIQENVKTLLAATFLLVGGVWAQRCNAGESDFPNTTSAVAVPGGDGHWYLILIGIILTLAFIACILYVKWPGNATAEGYPYSRNDGYSGHRTGCDKNKFPSLCRSGRGDTERRSRDSTQAAAIAKKRKYKATHRYVGLTQTITEKSKETKRVVGDVVRAMEELSATTGQLRRTASFIKGYAIQSKMAVVSAATKSVSAAAIGPIDMGSADKRPMMCNPRELAEKTVNSAEEATLLVERFQGRAMRGLELAWDLQTKITDVHELICRTISPPEISKRSDGVAPEAITEPSDEEETNYSLGEFLNDITDFDQKTPRHDNGFHVDIRWPR